MNRRLARGILAGLVLAGLACQKPGPPPRAPAAASLGKLRIFPAPDYPDAAVVIADRLIQSQAEHRTLLVFESATWCDPCRRFHAAAGQG